MMRMLFAFFVLALLASLAPPALAQTTCPAPYLPFGPGCEFNAFYGWRMAGQGGTSRISYRNPENAKDLVNYDVIAAYPTIGKAYSGYYAVKMLETGTNLPSFLVTPTGNQGVSLTLNPGAEANLDVVATCWDPTCTAPAPAGVVPNAGTFWVQVRSETVQFASDLDLQLEQNNLTYQFGSGKCLGWQAQVPLLRQSQMGSEWSAKLDETALPANRYKWVSGTGCVSAVDGVFSALTLFNSSDTQPTQATVTIADDAGIPIVSTATPAIPPRGALGYLLAGRNPGDGLGLFPSSLALPADTDGQFRGNLVVQFTTGSGSIYVQRYEGYSMQNIVTSRVKP